MQTLNPAIKLSGVTKTYGSNVILKNINLSINQGEFICIRGRSGAGKTSLFKLLALLEQPTAGSVNLFGQNTVKLHDGELADLRLHKMGLVFQFFNLLPSLTVMENVELPMALAGVKRGVRQLRARELLDYFGLAGFAERFPEGLSGGERQRVAVVRALVNRPRLVLADEATSSLDDENAALVLGMLRRVNREEGVTVVFTTTDLYEPLLGASADYVLRGGVLETVVTVGAKVE
jgi:putative ABC transport system ATP-binding protein